MFLTKVVRYFKAQFNKFANWLRGRDPIAEMQYECDLATEQLKDGRRGLEQYRGLVERVTRQVTTNKNHCTDLEGKIRTYLAAGDRVTAATLALELQRTETQLKENQAQLEQHEKAYQNNLLKLQHASSQMAQVKQRIARYDSELRMGKAEAEIAKIAQSFNFDVTTDFGQIEHLIQDKIDENKGQVRVAADLSSQGIEDIKRAQALERAKAEEVLQRFEQEHKVSAAPVISASSFLLEQKDKVGNEA